MSILGRITLPPVVPDWPTEVLASVPVHFWRLGDVGTVARDEMGSGGNGAYVAAPSRAQPGLVADRSNNTAVAFNGTSQYVTVPSVALPVTVEGWVSAVAQSGKAVYSQGAAGGANPKLAIGSGTVAQSKLKVVLVSNSGSTLVSVESAGAVFDLVPRYVAVAIGAGAWAIYIDGALDSQGSYTDAATTFDEAALAAQVSAGAYSNFLGGTLDEVAVYSRALTAEEALKHYRAARRILPTFPNAKWGARFAGPAGGRTERVTFYADTKGPDDVVTAIVRAVIYDPAENVVAQSADVQIGAGIAGRWFDLPFLEPGGVLLPTAGDYIVAIHSKQGSLLRLYGWPRGSQGGKYAVDPYSDGASSPFGGGSIPDQLVAFMQEWPTFVPSPTADNFYYARLPFPEAQAKIGEGAPLRGTRVVTQTMWHGTKLDPERGSFAIVRAGGPLTDLVGRRIKVTRHRGSSVYAFVHNEADFDPAYGDLSLSRRCFFQIAELANDTIPVIVQTMGPPL